MNTNPVLTSEPTASEEGSLDLDQIAAGLTVCDRERIHEIGAIQGTGFLVAVRPDAAPGTGSGLIIVALSENLSGVPWVLETDVHSLVGKGLSSLLDNNAVIICDQVSKQVYSSRWDNPACYEPCFRVLGVLLW
jgi:light-regulated signal transduction histidine kinase (bacteriophytochrome)